MLNNKETPREHKLHKGFWDRARMWMICENLRGFTTSRPPLVLFVLSLGAFAICLLTLAYLVKVKEFRNPDERDWNTFLDGFKQLEFCIINEDVHGVNSTKESLSEKGMKDVVHDIHSKLKGDDSYSTSPVTYDPNRIVSVSMPLWADIAPTSDFVNTPHNVTHLSITMNGKQIGVTGEGASVEFNVSLSLPYTWNSSLCKPGKKCDQVKILTCVNFQAPVKFFPQKRIPEQFGCQMMNDTMGAETRYSMVTQRKGSGSQHMEIVCNKKPVFTLNHQTEQGLNIMLTLQDRSAINLHLMHTSYFLFVMVVTMLCYAIVKGKPSSNSKPVQYTEVSHA